VQPEARFGGAYRDKKVLVFGHTGFKGSWLTLWLNELGARVAGVSLDIPTRPSHFEAAAMEGLCDHRMLDIRDRKAVADIIEAVQPDYVFHLAAQALVGVSYEDPVTTFQTNAMGTMNILEGLRKLDRDCNAVIITSDKCYENVETYYGYRETDALGGKDPYSASKGAAEIVLHSYLHSFFPAEGPVRIASTRAGNVVGGGDWAAGRLVPDIVRAWAADEVLQIRRPQATRPWLHVLEPLSGYLHLGAELGRQPGLHAEAFNFGPRAEAVHSVADVVERLSQRLDGLRVEMPQPGAEPEGFHEAGLLKLVCDKALHHLNWQPVLDFEKTMQLTATWYESFHSSRPGDFADVSRAQLDAYVRQAREAGLSWAAP